MKKTYTLSKIFCVLLLTSEVAFAIQEQDVQCYQFPVEQSPDLISKGEDHGSELWCYKKLNDGKDLLVFNFDQEKIRPELSVLIEEGSRISSGVLNSGKLSFTKSNFMGISPVNVPLEINALRNRALERISFTASGTRKIDKLIENLKAAPLSGKKFEPNLRSTETAYLDASKYPYGGYWWSHSDQQLFAGKNSPLGKYDSAYTIRNGENPNASAWESQNHSLSNVPWGGHCNGWAASSVLYPEWTETLFDPLTNQMILPTDVQGILAEGSFCVYWAFYGKRYNGNPGDDLTDIKPDLFHKVLRYYLDNQKKPIAMDYFRDQKIDNNVVSGYKSEINPISNRPNWYHVVTELQMHDYDHVRNEGAGPARMYHRNYEYNLQMEANGTITGGEWISENPDFLWVPLSPKDCGRENPNIHLDFVFNWLNSLPKAVKVSVPLDISIDKILTGGTQTIFNSTTPLVGSEFTFKFNQFFWNLEYLDNKINAEAALYPSIEYSGNINNAYSASYNDDYDEAILFLGENNYRLKVSDLKTFEFQNPSSETLTFPSGFKIESLEYWAPPSN